MYCPKCSQQQPAEGMRFCSRCGFTLGGVALLMDNNGVIPQVQAAPLRACPSRNRIMLESGILTAFAWVVALFATTWFDAGGPTESVAKFAAFLFALLGIIGVLRFLYGFLFAKDSSQPALGAYPSASAQHSLRSETIPAALPAAQSLPISDYPLRTNTKEMQPQPSVTENTTRLLDEQAQLKEL
jgi:hypothetical protein